MPPQIIESATKLWKNLFIDEHGLNLPAVAYSVAWAAAIIVAIRTTLQSGRFDFLQYSLGISVLLIGYGAAAGSRARTNGRIAKLEARIAELERSQGNA